VEDEIRSQKRVLSISLRGRKGSQPWINVDKVSE